jgi:predicted ATPase
MSPDRTGPQAIPYWQQAGQRALQRSANQEAIEHLTTGLELLAILPETPERIQCDLDIQMTLGPAMMAVKGLNAPEVGRVYTRARELCQLVGETPQLFPVLFGLWRYALVRGEMPAAQEFAERLSRFAQDQDETQFAIGAHWALGATLCWRGELVAAHAHLEQAIALYNPSQHHTLPSMYAADPGVVCRLFTARLAWLQGYPLQALLKCQEALKLAQEVSHLHTLAWAHAYAAILHQFYHEWLLLREHAEAAVTLAAEHGFPYWQVVGTTLVGWTVTVQGQGEEGMLQMRQGLTAFQTAGVEIEQSYFLALLAEAYGEAGQPEKGLAVLAEALALVDTTGVRWWEAELHRCKGEALLKQLHLDEPQAETCFHHALAIARRQQAKSLELRAAVSLSRLWQRQGKRTEARELLAPIYGWFTEGFDTADLQDAKALLAELS